MIMKTKYTIFVILFGFLINIIASALKIMHWPNGSILLIVGCSFEIFGALLFLYKLFTYPRFKEFMNW